MEHQFIYFGKMLFQSLFSWNSLFDLITTLSRISSSNGFNPCFPGTRSSTTAPHVRSVVATEFQSLFSWNSLFDPCFLLRCQSIVVVSILVFLELALRHSSLVIPLPAGPVSILVFLELALRQVLVYAPEMQIR